MSPPRKVLLHIHPLLDALDFIGPLEIFSHSKNEGGSQAFACTITSAHELTTSDQGVKFARDVDIKSAYSTLSSYDILIIPGGGTEQILEANSEPLGLIRAFAALPARPNDPRVLLSVCTASLFLASQGVLKGLTATTHPIGMDRLRRLCGEATKVVDDRFVVNPVDEEKGLRVITSGGISCGLDATLWLVEHLAGTGARESAQDMTQYSWREGLVLG